MTRHRAGDAPALFETMRAEGGHIPRLGRHLARLSASAAAFGIPFDAAAAVDALATHGEGLLRIRLTLHPDGGLSADAAPLLDPPFLTAWICPDPVGEAGGPLCTHKTTRREHYDSRWRAARARGADEAIVVNPAGEVMEGSRTNVWAALDGGLWTPPLAAGGLPGVERAHLLASRRDAGERVLHPADLERADAVFLSNALRGLMRVEMATEPRA